MKIRAPYLFAGERKLVEIVPEIPRSSASEAVTPEQALYALKTAIGERNQNQQVTGK